MQRPAPAERYLLLWPREAFLTLALFAPRAPVRGAFGAAFLRAARLTFLRSCLSAMLLVFAMYLANLSFGANFRNLEALQLGEFFYQLLHAVLLKLYCNLRVVPIAFAAKYRSFAILRVSDPRTLLQSRLARGRFHLKLWPSDVLPSRSKEACDVVDRSAGR
jgi:hypothetical protein